MCVPPPLPPRPASPPPQTGQKGCETGVPTPVNGGPLYHTTGRAQGRALFHKALSTLCTCFLFRITRGIRTRSGALACRSR